MTIKNLAKHLQPLLKSDWQKAMTIIDDELPFLSSDGRPSYDDIEVSHIGRAGYKSFKDYCNATADKNGLGLPYNTYKQWRKSWSIVKERSFLISSEISPSMIFNINALCVKSGIKFPETDSDFKIFMVEYNNNKSKNKINTNENLKKSVSELKNKISELEIQNLILISSNETLNKRLDKQMESYAVMVSQKDILQIKYDKLLKSHEPCADIKITNSKNKNIIKNYNNLGFFRKLLTTEI